MRISKILILASITTALGCPAGDDSDDGAGTDPGTTTDDPSTTAPTTTDPATTDPVTTDPVTTDPVTTDPATTEPGTETTDPGTETTDPDTGTETGGDSVECVAYCTAFLATCQDAEGAGLDGADPYADEAACLDACSAMDPGTPADTGGNTVGCRTYHVGAAAAMPDMGHCGHADADGTGVCA